MADIKESVGESFTSKEAADRLIAAHDGTVALLYIYYKRKDSLSLEGAATDLYLTLNEVRAADEKLQRMGLIPRREKPAPRPVDSETRSARKPVLPEAPVGDHRVQYNIDEVAHVAETDEAFALIRDEAEKLIGRKLGSEDLRRLYGIYNGIGIPAEVYLMLLNYCADLNRERYKGQRKLTAYFIEKEAYKWSEKEILTVEQAEEYVSFMSARKDDIESLATSLGIHTRPLPKSVREMLDSWFTMGFGEEEIMLAYDRSMIQTSGKLSLRYINAILERWSANNLFTLHEISEKDPPRSMAQKNSKKQPEEQTDKPNRNRNEDLLRLFKSGKI